MKFISWNVNGLRACLKKGFMESFRQLDADIFALQETKMQPDQAILELPGYRQYWNSAEKKGYSGTAVFTRIEPLQVTYGLGIEEHDHEGRVITLELPDYYGRNLDALYDCLTDLQEDTVINLCCTMDGSPVSAYLQKMRQVFMDAEEENPHLAVFFLTKYVSGPSEN